MERLAAIDRLATPVLLICAVVVTGIIARREFFPPTPQNQAAITEVRNWRRYAAEGSRVGANVAPITIVEFSDFQCPFCGVLSRRLDSLRTKYPDKLQLIYRHVPIDNLHPHARQAARASFCADRQGAFSAYHDRLFSNQGAIGLTAWSVLALQVGIADTLAFNACFASRAPDARLTSDSIAAQELHLRGTPLMLFNERLISGAPSAIVLDSLVRHVLQQR